MAAKYGPGTPREQALMAAVAISDATDGRRILALSGRLRDHRGSYGPGDICRSATGSEHSETAEGPDDCVCYVVYHGGHEMLE